MGLFSHLSECLRKFGFKRQMRYFKECSNLHFKKKLLVTLKLISSYPEFLLVFSDINFSLYRYILKGLLRYAHICLFYESMGRFY